MDDAQLAILAKKYATDYSNSDKKCWDSLFADFFTFGLTVKESCKPKFSFVNKHLWNDGVPYDGLRGCIGHYECKLCGKKYSGTCLCLFHCPCTPSPDWRTQEIK